MLPLPFPPDATVSEVLASQPAALPLLAPLGYCAPGCPGCTPLTLGEWAQAERADLAELLAELGATPEPASFVRRPFTKETRVGAIARWVPDAVHVFERLGFHHADCLVCTPLTLAEVARRRNVNLDTFLADLEAVPQSKVRVLVPYDKDTVIAEIFQRCPEAFHIFEQLGYKCYDCIVCYTDTVEVAARLHGKDLRPLLDALAAVAPTPRAVARPYGRSARVCDVFHDCTDTMEVFAKYDFRWGDCVLCARETLGEVAEKKNLSLAGFVDELNRVDDPVGSARPPWTAATPVAGLVRDFPATAEVLGRRRPGAGRCPRCSRETVAEAAARTGTTPGALLDALHALPRPPALAALDPERRIGDLLKDLPGAGVALEKMGYRCAGCVVRGQDSLHVAARLHEKNLEVLLDGLATLLPHAAVPAPARTPASAADPATGQPEMPPTPAVSPPAAAGPA